MTQEERLHVIRGNVASPLRRPPGCAFASRCDHAFERCAEDPPLFAAGAACWLCENGPRRTEAGVAR